MIDKRKQTENILMEHHRKYPKLQITDIFKFLYQSSYGCEHLVSDLDTVIKYISKEVKECPSHIGELIEPLDGNYCRVHLGYLAAGLSINTLGKLFYYSAQPVENGKDILEEKLSIFVEMVKNDVLPFELNEVENAIEEWRDAGYPACHHSNSFRENYYPVYRVVRKDYAVFLPLFLQIDQMLKMRKVTMAIEGGSASGKTTLSRILNMIYDASVFHMDDFFLRPEQRTQERLAEPGENIDWERFLDEVLRPIKCNKDIYYRRYNCSTLTIEPPVNMRSSNLNIIEGVYSMHPKLAGNYDLSVFLNISQQMQKMRIEKRNSPAMAERFFKEWIPMENQYFMRLWVKERCNIVIDIL